MSSCKRGLGETFPAEGDGAAADQEGDDERSSKRCKVAADDVGSITTTDTATAATAATPSSEGGFASLENKNNPFAAAADSSTQLTNGFASFASVNPFALAAAAAESSSSFGASSGGGGGFSSFINKNPFEAIVSSSNKEATRVGSGFASFASTNPLREAASAGAAISEGCGSGGSMFVAKRAADGVSREAGDDNDNEGCDNNDSDNDGGDNDQGDSPRHTSESIADYTSTKIFDFESHKQPVVTGEEDEVCILQLRTKLFRLSVDNGPAAGSSSDSTAAAASEWVEVGTGPVKILRSSDSSNSTVVRHRIVMRREEKKGGLGTKLILNARLQEFNAVERLGGKFFRLSCANMLDEPVAAAGGGGVITSYLFKANHEADLGKLFAEIAAIVQGLAGAASCSGGGGSANQ